MANSEVELTGEIAAADFESFRSEVMEEFRKELELPGFRKGRAPDNLLIEKVGAEKILYEMAEHALSHYYPDILSEHQVDAIGRPEITITKIAAGNPLGFKVKTAVMPEVKLPDYRKIAKKENEEPLADQEPTEQEMTDLLDELRKNRAHALKHESGEEHDHQAEVPREQWPELNDEFAKSLGNFASLDELTAKLKENLTHDKRHRAVEKRRLAIMDRIIDGLKAELPEALIESELHKMNHEMRSQLESMGLKFEDYLAHLKKTEADLEKDWRPEAEKRVKFGLALAEIAKTEKISVEAAKVEEETTHLLAHYQDADPARVRAYTESLLVNEEVFKFLENQK